MFPGSSRHEVQSSLVSFYLLLQDFQKTDRILRALNKIDLIAHDILKIGDQLAMLAYYLAAHYKWEICRWVQFGDQDTARVL